MLSPKTYRGYDEEGKVVITKTAKDANSQINPAQVKKAIENVKKVFEDEMQVIAKSLTKISEDAEEAIIVQGTDMGGTLLDTSKIISEMGTKMTEGIDSLYDYAVQMHDKLQKDNNTAAYNACCISGVASIR
ncbi:MAG: hypothetical protein IKF71_01175 [Bacilli bacterium]|nr:hypothetical protein [Bacilli bacterium]